jgi:hypothetical protein
MNVAADCNDIIKRDIFQLVHFTYGFRIVSGGNIMAPHLHLPAQVLQPTTQPNGLTIFGLFFVSSHL